MSYVILAHLKFFFIHAIYITMDYYT